MTGSPRGLFQELVVPGGKFQFLQRDTDTVVASARAYVNALNRLLIRRGKEGPGFDVKGVSYKDAG